MEDEEGVGRVALLHQLMPWADINGLHSGSKLEQQLVLQALQINEAFNDYCQAVDTGPASMRTDPAIFRLCTKTSMGCILEAV